MNRIAGLVIAGLVLMLGVTLSWGGPPNPTESDANRNTAGGTDALENVTGFDSTAFGSNALFSNTTGDRNTASGTFALSRNTTGSDNTATGATALFSNTTGGENTATGVNALFSNTTGFDNTATGANALLANTTGILNTASGASALVRNTIGTYNTATGAGALTENTTGFDNTATGTFTLNGNTTGARNTAFGSLALGNSNFGSENIAVGHTAGLALHSGDRNIYLGHPGASTESQTMRLGSTQTRTFVAGVATTAVSGNAVHIDANGQLGVLMSSVRYKRDIEPMGARSEDLSKLRPVTFVYTHDGQGVRQYGLIAEEVATVYPELVTHTRTGEVQAVRYHELLPLLLNELQRQQRQSESQQRELDELRGLVRALVGGKALVQE